MLVVTQAPHQKTQLHDHKVNRVMIYLQPGKQNFDYPETKKTQVLTWKAGEAKTVRHIYSIRTGIRR